MGNGVTQALMGRQSPAFMINKICIGLGTLSFPPTLSWCSVNSDATMILLALEGNIMVLYIPCSYKENLSPS